MLYDNDFYSHLLFSVAIRQSAQRLITVHQLPQLSSFPSVNVYKSQADAVSFALNLDEDLSKVMLMVWPHLQWKSIKAIYHNFHFAPVCARAWRSSCCLQEQHNLFLECILKAVHTESVFEVSHPPISWKRYTSVILNVTIQTGCETRTSVVCHRGEPSDATLLWADCYSLLTSGFWCGIPGRLTPWTQHCSSGQHLNSTRVLIHIHNHNLLFKLDRTLFPYTPIVEFENVGTEC